MNCFNIFARSIKDAVRMLPVLMAVVFAISGCASSPMTPVMGMKVKDLNQMAAMSVLGGIRLYSKHPELENVEIWETYEQQSSRQYGKKPDPNGAGFFYFLNGILVEKSEVDRQVAIQRERIERAKWERETQQRQQIERDRERENQRIAQQRQIREDIERKEQQKQQQAQRAKEQCLGNGQIGICQSSSQNNIQFLCGQNTVTALENIFNQYCYVTDKFNIKTTMEVRNNTGRAVKDISFACEQNAKSGTVLRRGEKTVYDVWGPGESKIITLEFIKHEQVQSMTCRARSWQ